MTAPDIPVAVVAEAMGDNADDILAAWAEQL